jgi:hypothetical protein
MSDTNPDLYTGITTRERLEHVPYGHEVEWIAWDSDFRNSDLRHGDIIVAVDDKRYLKETRDKEFSMAVGNYAEPAYWRQVGAKPGQQVHLEVWREGKFLSITGKLQPQQFYYTAENRSAMGPGGPERLVNDGFSSPWSGWYEKFVKNASMRLIDPRWERMRINNVVALEEHMADKERVDFLVKNYPGPFAESVQSDWETVRKSLEGFTYTDITEESLKYRKIGEQRAALIREEAEKAQRAFRESLGDRLINPFPAVDPIEGDVTAVAGKVVELPAITMRQFINDLGKSYVVAGSPRDGYYIIHVNDPEMNTFFGTLFRYQGKVTPDIAERYQFYGEIQNDPLMVTYDGRPATGLMLKVVGVMAGQSSVFVDLRNADGKSEVPFAGEEKLSSLSDHTLNDSATPRQVIEAMIHYIKYADKNSWQNLFANWRAFPRFDGPPVIDMSYELPEGSFIRTWDQSRRQILGDVYDARVIYEGPHETVIEEDEAAGIPRVEQAKVIVDHVGKFGNTYRSLSNINVHRKWILQRINDGPWKILELQSL